jgi:hypothetical protein
MHVLYVGTVAVLQIRIVTRLLLKVATNECSASIAVSEFTPHACYLRTEDARRSHSRRATKTHKQLCVCVLKNTRESALCSYPSRYAAAGTRYLTS